MFNFRRRTPAEVKAEIFATNGGTEPAPERFVRTEIANGVNLYSAGRGAQHLVVGFGSMHAGLMMPASTFLDNFDGDKNDLLLLADFSRLFFDSGIEGYATSLPELMGKVGDFGRLRGYRAIITYGASMGGFPALRGGDLLEADRAISVGGRYAWHPRYVLGNKGQVSAFDSLCHCRAPFRTQFYNLYSGNSQPDVGHSARIAAILPGCHNIALPARNHNFPMLMERRGTLSRFHAEMFDLDREPDTAYLGSLLNPFEERWQRSWAKIQGRNPNN